MLGASVIRRGRIPAGVEERLASLGEVLGKRPEIVFAYLFGGAARGRLTPLSDIDVGVFLDEDEDPVEARLAAVLCATRHLRTDEIDLVVLNGAPTALVGRILGSRRVIHDRDPFRRQRFESLAARQFAGFRIFEWKLLERRYAAVDRELIFRKLADLELYVSQLSEFRGLSVEAYCDDWKVQRIVECTLEMAIELCVDLANHIIADRRLRVPSTYAEAFEVLGEASLLDAELSASMIRMAGFRNLVVHEYARIDAQAVVRILRERLPDFGRFIEAARSWV